MELCYLFRVDVELVGYSGTLARARSVMLKRAGATNSKAKPRHALFFQTTYDIRYYTNDWWHRMFFASQLGVYAVLASFSGSFNVAWKVLPGSSDTFIGDSTASTAEAMAKNQEIWTEKSFRGVNMVLFLSRLFLFAQYARGTLVALVRGGVAWTADRATSFFFI